MALNIPTKTADPDLSIVVAVIAGGKSVMETCLGSIAEDTGDISLECLVPYDARLDGIEELETRFPWVTFIDSRNEVPVDEFGSNSREHHDILRAVGLREATAPIVGLLEDHGIPGKGWCKAVLRAHQESDAAVIGGAVENGTDRLLNWAVYYCDFGRYQNPVAEGDVEFASDSNVSYKRDRLIAVKRQWLTAFHETSVNWEIRRRGGRLQLDPSMVIYQTRQTLRLLPAFKERFVWGRSFAGTRAAEMPGLRRLIFAVFSFVLPLLLTGRILIQGLTKGRRTRKLLAALPLVFFLQIFWAVGEFVGYVTGRAERPRSVRAQMGHNAA